MALTILLSGFGPFPGAPCNPTGALVQGLARSAAACPLGRAACAACLSNELSRRGSRSAAAADRVAAGRGAYVRAFRQGSDACRWRRGRAMLFPLFVTPTDNRRLRPALSRADPAALWFGAPAARLAVAARNARIQAVISRDAGRYLCNYLSWRAIEATAGLQGQALRLSSMCPSCGRRQSAAAPREQERGGCGICCAAGKPSCSPPPRRRAGAST